VDPLKILSTGLACGSHLAKARESEKISAPYGLMQLKIANKSEIGEINDVKISVT